MADTVNVSQNKGTAYTWKTSPFIWKDAIKSWRDASPNQFTVSRLAYVTVAERLRKTTKSKYMETARLRDVLKKRAAARRFDGFKVADKTFKKPKKLAGKETMGLTEKSHRHPKPKKVEQTLRIAERKKLSMSRLLYEKLRFTETYWDNILFKLHILEMFKTRDVVKKRASHELQDSFNVSDKGIKHPTKRLKEVARATDLIRKHEAKRAKDSFRLLDDVLRKFKLVPTDGIRLRDVLKKRAAARRFDGFTTKDEFLRHAVMWLGFEESLRMVEKSIKRFKDYHAESFNSTDNYNNSFAANNLENLNTIDGFDRLFIIRKTIEDNIKVAELLKKQYSVQNYESVQIYDAYIKACEAVLSNLAIRYGELDDESFMKLVNAPSGYTDFTDFKVGEYEYEEALVRIILETKVPQTPASVADVVVHVDIPDTDDRGIAEITDTTAATKVRFNKHYYNPPEVNVVLRAGSTADGNTVPYIVSTDGKDDAGRYFEVELIGGNGERTTGTISWVSKGY